MWQSFKKIKIGQKPKAENVTKLNNSKWEPIQKLKMSQNSKCNNSKCEKKPKNLKCYKTK